MRHTDFVSKVRARAELASDEHAARCVAAFFQTLGERLHRPQRDKLASQIPDELKSLLYLREDTEEFLLEEFYNRVGARSGFRYGEAVRKARVIASVLREAVSEGEIAELLSQLPDNYAEVFGRRPQSPLSPTSLG
jgi:uncharacterized protein (DUF2267 family)